MKVLVLEHVGHMETVLADYISQTFPDCKLIFVPNMDTVDTPTIISHVMNCDIICVQSMFDDTTSFEKMIALFHAKQELIKPTYLIHSTGKLLEALNTGIDIPAYIKLTDLLDKGLKLHNIYYKEYDHPDNAKEYFGDRFFRKVLRMFDTVPVWFDKGNNIIWDERPYYVPQSTKVYFKPAPATKVKPEKKTIVDCLTPKEIKTQKELLQEMYAFTSDRKEDLELGIYKDEPETIKTLLAEKKAWLKVMDKIGINN